MLKHLALVYVVTTFLILFCGALPQRSGRQVAEDAKCIEDTKQMAPEQLTLLEELSEQKDKEAYLNVLAIETKSTQDDAESKQSEEEMKIELAKQAESPCGMPAKTQTAINAIKPTQTVKQAKMLSKAMATTTTTTAKPEIRESAKEELKEPKGTSRSPTAGRMVFPSATAPRMSVDEPQGKTKTTNDGRIVFPKNDINSEEDDRLTEYKEYQMQLAKMSSTSTTTTPAPSTAAVDMPNISTQPPSGNATDPSGRNPKGGIEVVNRGIFDIAPSCKADEIYTNGACHRRA